MGTVLESAVVVRDGHGLGSKGALRQSDAAAVAALDAAGLKASDVDLLINAGLYRERHLQEPAFASLIQEDIGANPGHPPRAGLHGTFSFDVLNGSCGMLTGAWLIDGFLRSGAIETGLVVAADAGSRFPAVAGAIVLRNDPETPGFVDFAFATHPEDSELFTSSIAWEPDVRRRIVQHGRNVLTVVEQPTYAERCVRHAADDAVVFLDHHGIDAPSVDLLIANHTTESFGGALAQALGIPSARVVRPAGVDACAHTAGTAAAAAHALEDGRLVRGSSVLFVAAGAGITTALALYRV